jgi:hypothetical protein
MTQRFYVAGDGAKYVLKEAALPFSFPVYRSGCKSAVIGDPVQCIIAKSGQKHPNVYALYIGSGKDAYVIMKDGPGGKLYAVHYRINTKAARVRDLFDTDKKLKSQMITLSVPTEGVTLAHRSVVGKRRRDEIKNGSPVTKRSTPSLNRQQRLGVKQRPRAKIVDNVVTLESRDGVKAA